MLDKWSNLSDIAFKFLDWEKIVEKIIKSVKEVIGVDDKSNSNIDNKNEKNIGDVFIY